jgi:hypothetical protein
VMVASPAFASRARLESLGEGKNGSYYINDGRNIFLNPAAINGYKKNMWLELGSETPTADAVGAANTQKVQGGFTNTFGDFTYGVYVGRDSDRALNAVAGANGLGAGFTAFPANSFEFFFGGEQGVKWGASVFHSGNLVQTSSTSINTSSILGAKVGVETNGINVFSTVGISSSVKNDTTSAASTNELKGKVSVDVGATYAMDDFTYLAKFSTFGSEYTPGTAVDGGKVANSNTTAFGVGAGWKKEATKSVNMYSRIQFDYQTDKVETENAVFVAGGAVSNTTSYNLPLIVAAEAQATSWLTIRGSVSHSLIGQTQTGNAKSSYSNTTSVAAGLGFNFGDLTVDALAGQSGAAGAAGSEGGLGTSQAGSQFGFGQDMIGRLSLNYKF